MRLGESSVPGPRSEYRHGSGDAPLLCSVVLVELRWVPSPLEHFHPRQPTSLNVTNILKVGILTHFKYSTLYVISLSSSFRSFQAQKLSSLTVCSPIIHLSGKTLSVSSIFPFAILSFQFFFSTCILKIGVEIMGLAF